MDTGHGLWATVLGDIDGTEPDRRVLLWQPSCVRNTIMIDVKIQKKQLDIDKIKEGKVRVGWWGNIKYGTEDGKEGPSVAQVARWNEFGTP